MPYRRLPNTDSARLKSMKAAYAKGKELPPFKLAFSPGSFRKMQGIMPRFEAAIKEHKTALKNQAEKNKEYQKRLKKVKLYISHFIQVVNLAVIRGDLPTSTRVQFGLDENEKKVPSLNSEEEVILWGQKLIEGEQKRRNKGLNPITNPTIAVLKVHFDKFIEYHNYQKSLKDRSQRAQEQLNEKRDAIDHIIQQIWNEVERSYVDLPEEMRREKAMEYGLVYVFRKSELDRPSVSNPSLFQSRQMESIG